MRRSLPPLALVALTALACQKKAAPQPTASASPSTSAAAVAAPAAPTGIRIAKQLPAQGSKRHDVVTRWLRFDPPRPDGAALTIEEHLRRDIEVLAVSASAVTKIKLSYGEVTTSVTEGKTPARSTTDPRSGKTFVLTEDLGQLKVTDADGAAVDDDLAATITSDHVALGLPFPLPSLLPDEPLTKGDDFDLSHDAVLALFPVDADGDFDVTRMTLIFEGATTGKSKTLKFLLKTRFWGVHGGRRIELDVEGPLVARAPGAWPERLSLEGPAKLLAKAGDEPAAARPGRATVEVVSKYE
jgi:hypothetical protein